MKKILLIEDNQDVREATVDILELASYEVITADNGRSGVQQALACRPDLIVCDIMMPVLDGYGVLHILSKNPETAGIPFIFLTAKSEKTDMRKGMNLGADDYLTKPFEGMELLDAVESRLLKSELLKKDYARNAEGFDTFLFEASQFRELHDLSRDKKLRVYKKKTNIFLEGSWANLLYYINKGQVKTFKSNLDGKEFITGIWGPGEFIGYMPLLGKKDTYSETATALGEVEVSTIPREDFLKLLYNNREVAGKFIKMLSNNLMEREQQLLQIAYHSIRQRVAEALLKLDEQYGKESMGFSRDDLAGMVGTVKETVIRTLSDFKEEGLIKIERKEITVLDKDKLIKATR